MTSHTVINTSRIFQAMLLCEAQRVYENRWTEIQRKDKVVNNMFARLCMKRAKHETMASEDKSNKNRMLFLDGSSTPANIKLLLPIEQGASSICPRLHILSPRLDKQKLTIFFDNPNIGKSKEKSLFLGHFHAKGTVRQKIEIESKQR
ncbi:hypothetical protein IGI04_026981 [Brassica rapa subsp. trilocularis]|uniref:Uncharacterized protein n=2 Tax=Brassica TaxID=3705 RepID=A0ABQ7L049_BRACM|nr:hypothetical protein IGI04_026978 [Brassica rapa subsp. trilocularis]KAG5379139.1 hypothetical protein IGI04_026981 [Brassica rapa subsp. trilocularis]